MVSDIEGPGRRVADTGTDLRLLQAKAKARELNVRKRSGGCDTAAGQIGSIRGSGGQIGSVCPSCTMTSVDGMVLATSPVT